MIYKTEVIGIWSFPENKPSLKLHNTVCLNPHFNELELHKIRTKGNIPAKAGIQLLVKVILILSHRTGQITALRS